MCIQEVRYSRTDYSAYPGSVLWSTAIIFNHCCLNNGSNQSETQSTWKEIDKGKEKIYDKLLISYYRRTVPCGMILSFSSTLMETGSASICCNRMERNTCWRGEPFSVLRNGASPSKNWKLIITQVKGVHIDQPIDWYTDMKLIQYYSIKTHVSKDSNNDSYSTEFYPVYQSILFSFLLWPILFFYLLPTSHRICVPLCLKKLSAALLSLEIASSHCGWQCRNSH